MEFHDTPRCVLYGVVCVCEWVIHNTKRKKICLCIHIHVLNRELTHTHTAKILLFVHRCYGLFFIVIHMYTNLTIFDLEHKIFIRKIGFFFGSPCSITKVYRSTKNYYFFCWLMVFLFAMHQACDGKLCTQIALVSPTEHPSYSFRWVSYHMYTYAYI